MFFFCFENFRKHNDVFCFILKLRTGSSLCKPSVFCLIKYRKNVFKNEQRKIFTLLLDFIFIGCAHIIRCSWTVFSHVVVIFVYLFVDWLLLVLRSSEASRYLVEVLESVSHSELDDVIERVLDAVEKQPCECSTACCVLLCLCSHVSFFRLWLYWFFAQCPPAWSSCPWWKVPCRIALKLVTKQCKFKKIALF